MMYISLPQRPLGHDSITLGPQGGLSEEWHLVVSHLDLTLVWLRYLFLELHAGWALV